MNDNRLRVRANKSTGELEIEGDAELVSEWWGKLWPEVNKLVDETPRPRPDADVNQIARTQNNSQIPEIFGEFLMEFRSDITDVDRILIAGAFIQGRDPDKVFSTKSANQALMDQNIKVTNASESVRRLISSKRAFVVSDGKFRISSNGFEHLNTLKVTV